MKVNIDALQRHLERIETLLNDYMASGEDRDWHSVASALAAATAASSRLARSLDSHVVVGTFDVKAAVRSIDVRIDELISDYRGSTIVVEELRDKSQAVQRQLSEMAIFLMASDIHEFPKRREYD